MTEHESGKHKFSTEEKKIISRRTKELKSGKNKGISLSDVIKHAKTALKK